MELRTAAPEDLGKIMELIDQAKAFLKRNGVDQWQNGYPDQTCIEEDIHSATDPHHFFSRRLLPGQ